MEGVGAEAAFMAAAAGKAFITLMEPHRLMYLMAGCMMGLVLGIVPGIGGLAGTAMLLPFTFGMTPILPSHCCSDLAPRPPRAIPFPQFCSACPEVQPPRQRCLTASQWRSGVRPGARSAPPTCLR